MRHHVARFENGIHHLTAYQALGLDPLPERAITLPTVESAHVGADFAQVVLRYPTLAQILDEYLREHCIPSTSGARRAAQAAWPGIRQGERLARQMANGLLDFSASEKCIARIRERP